VPQRFREVPQRSREERQRLREAAKRSSTAMVALYVVLVAATIGGVTALIERGAHQHAQPEIAGGYDLRQPNHCFGPLGAILAGAALPRTAPAQPPAVAESFDVQQSGQFVSLSNAAGSLGGQVRLHAVAGGREARLTGTVDCVGGAGRRLAAVVRTGAQPQITGTAGGAALSAVLQRDPPDPGAPLPYLPSSISGSYQLVPRSVCFGGTMSLEGTGSGYALGADGRYLGTVSYVRSTGALGGDLRCASGGRVRLRATASGTSLDDVIVIPLDLARPSPSSVTGRPVLITASGLPPAGETFQATLVRDSFGRLLASFVIAVAVVIVLARLFGMAATRIGQPRVMGEVVAGIVLGPSVLGAISRQLQAQLFPADIVAPFAIAANLGLIFYMFLAGLELNPSHLRTRLGRAVAISNTSIALPLLLGVAVAVPLYRLLAPQTKFAAFALFLGVAMSTTAFPVLVRVLVERRMLERPVGALVLTCGAVDDAAGWFLIALAATIAVAGSVGAVAKTAVEAVAFCAVVAFLVRPVLRRVSDAFDQSGRVPPGWVALIFAGILLSAWATELIGIAAITGAFLIGLVMPRNADLTEDITRRIEDFTVTLLLPLFFAYTGLQMNISLLDRPVLWLITLALIGVAIFGKLAGAAVAARLGGLDWRSSALIGTLMNARGLTELIALGVALQQRVISSVLFTMMVLVSLITTFMAGPLVRVLDPRNELGAPVEDELVDSRERSIAAFPALMLPGRAILVAAQSDTALPTLRELAEPLARSQPPRELIVVRLVRPPRGAGVRGGLQSENALVRHAREEVDLAQRELVGSGIAARAVAFSSPHPGDDLARLAGSEEIDLLLVDGQRPLLGEPVPLVDIKPVLERAACDVGVLVAREGGRIGLGPGAPVLVPFGGAEHDWSALELGAWLASATGAPLKLLAPAASASEAQAVKRRLDDAGMLVREFAGIVTESVVVEGGQDGILAAARDVRLLIVGLSDRWRQEGLGKTRSQLARSSAAPVLFVRRGQRTGALAPREDFTRFSWSSADAGGGTPTSA
jgi:Kef-type K+ transport system membrane component KefB